MKKGRRMIAAALVVSLALLPGCQCSHEYDGGAITKEATCVEEGIRTYTCQRCQESYEEPIPLVEHRYSDKVTKEPTYEEEGTRTFTCPVCRDSYTESIPALEKPVEVTVTAKRKQYNFLFKWVELDFSVENLGDTDIRGFQGELVVRDVFGKELLSRRCQFTEPFPAGETVAVEDMSMLIDDYDEMEKKFYDTYLGDLQFFYKLEKVVFAQEEPEEEKIALEGPVTVKIRWMHAFPSDYAKNHIISSVQITLKMVNNTGKEIEGVDGTLIFQDMFGNELASKDCPLMRAKGNFWEGEWGYTLHFEINDFNREANVLYTEFQDLNFEYVISSILFEDGTQEFFQTPDGAINL